MDNRVDPRVAVRLPAEYRMEGCSVWLPGTLHDLSTAGAGILTAEPIPVQTLLTLRFALPAQPGGTTITIEVEAVSLRIASHPDLVPGRPHVQGLYFLGVHGDRYERIRRFVWETTAESSA